MIVSTLDNSFGIDWGPPAPSAATALDNGASNTAIIVTAYGQSINYAARVCSDYEIDSLGNTPCQPGNVCYNDWFLPAINQLNCLYTNRVFLGVFGDYWSSTSVGLGNARSQNLATSVSSTQLKSNSYLVRCVRAL